MRAEMIFLVQVGSAAIIINIWYANHYGFSFYLWVQIPERPPPERFCWWASTPSKFEMRVEGQWSHRVFFTPMLIILVHSRTCKLHPHSNPHLICFQILPPSGDFSPQDSRKGFNVCCSTILAHGGFSWDLQRSTRSRCTLVGFGGNKWYAEVECDASITGYL